MTELLTTADAARLLGVVPATVRQIERQGGLAAKRTPSGVRLFDREEVERLVEERRRKQERLPSVARTGDRS